MSRSADDILQGWIGQFLPPGAAFSRSVDSNIAGILAAFADVRSATEVDIDAFRLEISPKNSTLLLDDYKDVLGTDPCGRDQGDLTTAEWQALLFSRWTAVGGQSLAYYESLAANAGVSIEIDELEPAVCGEAVCGNAVCSLWSDIDVVVITLGSADSGLVCQITNNIPPETTLVLKYVS